MGGQIPTFVNYELVPSGSGVAQKMSEEVAIVAIIQPAPGKLDRVRELFKAGLEYIQANEPETLEFSIYEEHGEAGVKLFMVERYASQAAMHKHESSDNYKAFFKTMMDEEILAGPPTISKGKYWLALRR